MKLTPEQQILCNLLKIALWPEQDKEALLTGFKQVNWDKVISFASIQGVLGISYDGFYDVWKSKPQLLNIPKLKQIGWELSVKSKEETNKRQKEVIKELVTLFNDNGIEVLLLKGIGLGENYPLPMHRESGDIDLYLYGDYEKGNQMMESLDIEVERKNPKHAKFIFKGVSIENHKTFLDIKNDTVNEKLEKELHHILQEQGYDTLRIDETEVRIPKPDFTAIFLIRHSIYHFLEEGIVLRFHCDHALFFTRNAASINFSQFFRILEETSQLNLFAAFMYQAQKYLGMPTNSIPALAQNEKMAKKVFRDTIKCNPQLFATDDPEKRAYIKRKVVGAYLLLKLKWKHDLVEEPLFDRLKSSLLRSLK